MQRIGYKKPMNLKIIRRNKMCRETYMKEIVSHKYHSALFAKETVF